MKKYRVREGSIAYWAIYVGECLAFGLAMCSICAFMLLLGM